MTIIYAALIIAVSILGAALILCVKLDWMTNMIAYVLSGRCHCERSSDRTEAD